VAEIEKLQISLEKAQKSYEKKLAQAEKLGVADWDDDYHRDWLRSVPNNGGWMTDKNDIRKNGAWIDLNMAENRISEIEYKIEKAEKRLEKAEQEVQTYYDQIAQEADLRRKEELYRLEFEQEQKEWLKDGITLERRYAGTTPQGKRFCIMRNGGWTERSFHCYTLYIDGNVVFTSGEFWRAYGIIKKS